MSLEAYAKKRDFRATPEPAAGGTAKGRAKKAAAAGRLGFVIQKHAATRLHYDLRLVLDGALKSWAVPKGLPLVHGEKHLAVQVEDHPLAYADFEGVIPKGHYGGGTVMVWDTGTYETDSADAARDLAKGKLHFTLHGKKLRGAWHLVRLRDAEGDQWLVIRGGEDHHPISEKLDDTSVLSGKTMAGLAKSERVWDSRADEPDSAKSSAKPAKPAKPRRAVARSATASPAKAAAKPRRKSGAAAAAPTLAFFEPMKAKLVDAPPAADDWLYEVKFDGFRALALKDAAGLRLLSRNENDLAEKFPEVAEALAALPADAAIVDGEIVALDPEGRSSFQLLQAYELGDARPPLHFYAFDLPHLDGQDLRGLPLEERKARLEKLLAHAARPGRAARAASDRAPAASADIVRFSASLGGDAPALLEQARRLGLEGLIGKRAGSVYEVGRRSGAWIKLKLHHEQEFVIGGYTPPGGSRPHFGALIVGVHEGGELRFTGKVGTGFTHRTLAELHRRLRELAQDECPFADLPKPRGQRYGQAITASEMRRCHWVRPELVCQLKFAEWTREGSLRQPVFLGLREDKPAARVVRERPAAA